MLKEFKAFAMRGNVMDLAVGVVIGTVFSAIVKSLVGDIFMPVIGMITGGLDFSGLSYKMGDAEISYGNFLQAVFVFIVTAFALFLFMRFVNQLNRKQEEKKADPAPSPEVVLLTEIRDSLRK
jgi:large conductance mechanosensitive channel